MPAMAFRQAIGSFEIGVVEQDGTPADGDVVTSDAHRLAFLLRMPPGAAVRHPDLDKRDFEQIGRVMFQPKEVAWQFKAAAGPWSCIQCKIDDKMSDELFGPRKLKNRESFETGFNIRCAELYPIFEMIGNELRKPTFASAAIVESLGLSAIHYLARYLRLCDGQSSIGRYSLTDAQIRKIEARLDCASGDAPSVRELASLCGLSVRHLLRKCRDTLGMSASEYVAHRQLQKSKNLLLASRSIKQVASSVGFKSAANFSTAFRRRTGSTPAQFRRMRD